MFSAPSPAFDTGKVSYSGILSPNAVVSLSASSGQTANSLKYAFETLSAGRRFAVVPLADGGAFWFATLAAMAAGSSKVGTAADTVAALRGTYDGWHEPIPGVLHAVACDVAKAVMASESSTLRCDRIHVVPHINRWWDGRTVLVGDAAHALPINLAQGAACAVEGAYLLGVTLAEALFASPHDVSVTAAGFMRYQATHEPRVRQCRYVTSMTELLAAPSSPMSEAVRNAMRLVPQPLNGWVFVKLIDII